MFKEITLELLMIPSNFFYYNNNVNRITDLQSPERLTRKEQQQNIRIQKMEDFIASLNLEGIKQQSQSSHSLSDQPKSTRSRDLLMKWTLILTLLDVSNSQKAKLNDQGKNFIHVNNRLIRRKLDTNNASTETKSKRLSPLVLEQTQHDPTSENKKKPDSQHNHSVSDARNGTVSYRCTFAWKV